MWYAHGVKPQALHLPDLRYNRAAQRESEGDEVNKLSGVAILAVIVVALIIGGNLRSSTADITTARANIEASMGGYRVETNVVPLVAAGLVAVVSIAAALYFALRRKPAPKWTPGPNARWARKQPAPVDPMKTLVDLYVADQIRAENEKKARPEVQQVEEPPEEVEW